MYISISYYHNNTNKYNINLHVRCPRMNDILISLKIYGSKNLY